jgi:hypothetical protein
MLHLGLDLSRKRLYVCALDERGDRVAVTAAPPDDDGLRELVTRLAPHGGPVHAGRRTREISLHMVIVGCRLTTRSKLSLGNGRAASSGTSATHTPRGRRLFRAMSAFGGHDSVAARQSGAVIDPTDDFGEHLSASGLNIECRCCSCHSRDEHPGIPP